MKSADQTIHVATVGAHLGAPLICEGRTKVRPYDRIHSLGFATLKLR